MRIRIEMHPLDPDPYWEYGSGSRTVKMVPEKEKMYIFKIKRALIILLKT
jgi:hypothetical protein